MRQNSTVVVFFIKLKYSQTDRQICEPISTIGRHQPQANVQSAATSLVFIRPFERSSIRFSLLLRRARKTLIGSDPYVSRGNGST